VKRVVAEHDLDASKLPATGPKGNIIKEDVLRAVESQAKPSQPRSASVPVSPSQPQISETQTRVKMSMIRKKIAENLVLAQKTAAHLTTFNEIDMNAVMALRAEYKEAFEKQSGVRLGFMSFFIKAAQQALVKYPEINAFIEGDEIVYNHTYNIGVAMSTEKGLLTPVIREVEKKSFAEIEQAIIDFRDKALAKKLLPQELMGGTFTITNGGVFGSLLSTPIPNPPQSGILGMHTIQKRPVERNNEIVIRPMMYVALTYDHRIVDGREAIGFLIHIKHLIEDPNKLLLGI
jgi:2-oxoglutarate dehydrogenase E2 component (dihydrolipoamide succinyltransferase)